MNVSFYIRVYGYFGIFRLSIFRLRTFLVSRKIRLIRFPIEIRNRKQIDFGKGLSTGVGCRFEAWPYLHSGVFLPCLI